MGVLQMRPIVLSGIAYEFRTQNGPKLCTLPQPELRLIGTKQLNERNRVLLLKRGAGPWGAPGAALSGFPYLAGLSWCW